MTRNIHCLKLDREAEALTFAPYPGELGARIYTHISKAGWQLWLNHQTLLINEYRLNLLDPQAKVFLEKEMKQFLFGETKN